MIRFDITCGLPDDSAALARIAAANGPTNISKLAPMADEVTAVLICPRSTSHSDHMVNTVTGEAECTGCAETHVLEPAEVDALLVDA